MKIRSALSLIIASAMMAGVAHAAPVKTTVTDGASCYNRTTEDCNEKYPNPNKDQATRGQYDACINAGLDACDAKYPALRAPIRGLVGINGTVGVFNPITPKPKTSILATIPKGGALVRR